MSHALDTNVVLYHLAGKLAVPLPSGPLLVSIVTEIELLPFKPLTSSERNRITSFLSGVRGIDLDQMVKVETVNMRLT